MIICNMCNNAVCHDDKYKISFAFKTVALILCQFWKSNAKHVIEVSMFLCVYSASCYTILGKSKMCQE